MICEIYLFSGQCFSWVYKVDDFFTQLTNNGKSWRFVDKVDEVDEVDENDENDEIYEIDIFSSYFLKAYVFMHE